MDYNKAGEWLQKHKDVKFQRGVTDCCTTTSDFINHMTGIDPAENHRGTYDDYRGALRALKKYGTIEEIMDKYFERVDFKSAPRGSIVMYESEIGLTAGVKWTGGVISPHETGMVVAEVKEENVGAVWCLDQRK